MGRKSGLFTIAGYSAIVSAVVGVAMVITLIAMYGLFALGQGARETALKVGWVNDVLAIVVYGMALPVVPALHVISGRPARREAWCSRSSARARSSRRSSSSGCSRPAG